ncbi:hypothetical protein M3M39_03425 [Fructilactobacillus hinvesii]|uniref:Uncharacterized protein n=1 Tax=Fructilactobacillus hinvesii TaxID=2940300 RepID=A0ABY5BV39_9LACO|nr:hypothetical protein [Fructilactobacillus hinvesii]USS88535.1 hypothetical protein M3M39_03425 [Fructilactobacillus hinvesii]
MIKKIRQAITLDRIIVVVALIILVALVIWNVVIFNQRKSAQADVTTTQQKINKVSKDFTPKYRKTEAKAREEFKQTHSDPLNQNN